MRSLLTSFFRAGFFRAGLPALLGVLLVASPAQAQQQDPESDPSLPEIAPREVEIRGRLDISLPALRRPSLSGLLPAARLQPLPPVPLPQLEVREPGGDGPQALPDETAAAPSFAELPPPQRGQIEAGAGRYLSRFARARLDQRLAPQWTLRSRLDYTGTDGFAPFEGEDVETPADELRGSATLRTERPGVTAALTADGFFGQHQLYGTEGAASGVAAFPDRDRYGGGAALHLQAGGGEGAALEARARYDAVQTGADVFLEESGSDNRRFERGEQRVHASVSGGMLLGDGLRAEAEVRGSTASLSGGASEDGYEGRVSFVDGGAGAWLLRGGPIRLFAGARVLSFSSEAESGTYAAPDVRLEWQAAPRLALYAHTKPGIEANPLADRYRENPSLLYEAAPQPNVFTLDAEGGVRFFPAPALELHAFAGYRRAPSYLFYEAPARGGPRADALYARGVTAARYGEARILRAGGALSFRRGEAVHASLSVAYRDGQLEASGAEIPYFSPLVAEALFSYGFLEGNGRVEITGALESARPLTRAGEAEAGLFADLDVTGHYALTPSLSVVAGLHNIPAGALERFDRYPRPPLVFESGLRIRL